MILTKKKLVAMTAGAALLLAACGGGDPDAASPSPANGTTAPEDDAELAIPPVAATWNTDWSIRSIRLTELVVGIRGLGDSRDVIPPLDNPDYVSVAEASEWLDGREPVVLLELDGDAWAFPLQILTWHEIVNDVFNETPVAITYCPLCNSAVAFDRRVDGETLRFGVSGLLRKSDLVMWDDVTESLWQQITGEAIVGEMTGTQLEIIVAPLVPFSAFSEHYPDGEVLSRDTGYARMYGTNPYVGYDGEVRPFLFGGEMDTRFPAMERVAAVNVDGMEKAYPFSVIAEQQAVNDTVNGLPVAVFWGAADTASALDTSRIADGRAVGIAVAYEREVDGRVLTFEAAGEDRWRDAETGTTWDILGHGVSGALSGQSLTPVAAGNHLWFAWAAFNPDSPVYGG